MRTFSISYDLANPLRNKHALAAAIMNLGHAWARPLETTWYLRANITESDICDALAPCLDAEDSLVVQPIGEKVTLLNTSVRWFRQREHVPGREQPINVIAFATAAELVSDAA
jgi:hypothetical protein